MSDKSEIQTQFGQNAADYVHSTPHRKGASLERLLALVQPKPHWQVLDIATAVGFTAWTFAPHVAHVYATDITPEMLTLAQQEAVTRGLTNHTIQYADAENLPYPDNTFHLVTCRIAPHHFADIPRFVQEAVRVLKPKGLLAVVDNVVPEGSAGDYVNAFEKLRDPSHLCCFSVNGWLETFAQAGLGHIHAEIIEKRMSFSFWAKRHNEHTRRFLLALLTHAPSETAVFFHPATENGEHYFHLQEGIFIEEKCA
ncbi:MAG: class I SAM-dependent methyltransferase [Candidatus Promineifilaceae bacterium]